MIIQTLSNGWFWVSLMLLLILIVSLFYLYRFAKIILNVEDAVETCLDVLDARYDSMSKILEIPIFFDSIEVRQVIDNIKKSRDAILVVANILTQKVSPDEIKIIEVDNASKKD